MERFFNSLLFNLLNTTLGLEEDSMIVIIVVVSIIAVSIIGAIFYAKKDDE